MQKSPISRRSITSGALTTLTLVWQIAVQAAEISVVREYEEIAEQQRYDQLLLEFGNNKELPPGYELQALLALSHYPELKDIKIRFIVDDVGIPLSKGRLPRSQVSTFLIQSRQDRQGSSRHSQCHRL